jgi:PBP1b-binding outer membrane lipoprotein LpoB
MHYSILLLALLLFGCDQSSIPQEISPTVADTPTLDTPEAPTEGSQQYADIQAAKEALPGKAHY